MKKTLLLTLLLAIPLSIYAQDYEIINEVKVELPYYKSVTSALGQKISIHNHHILARRQLYYSFDGKKYRPLKEQPKINPNTSYIIEAIDTIYKKKQVFLRLKEELTQDNLAINITTGFDASLHLVNIHAETAFEEHIKENCKYRDIGFKVKYQGEKYAVTLPYSEYAYQDIYIKKELDEKPTIIILWHKGQYLTLDDTYLEYLAEKDEYLSEEKLQEAIKAEEARYDEILERLEVNSAKYGGDVAFALMEYEIDKKDIWWIKDEEYFKKIFDTLGERITAQIIRGEIQIGMPSVACWYAWGSADKEYKSTYSWGTTEQWVYREKGVYLYFENGILTSIQE